MVTWKDFGPEKTSGSRACRAGAVQPASGFDIRKKCIFILFESLFGTSFLTAESYPDKNVFISKRLQPFKCLNIITYWIRIFYG